MFGTSPNMNKASFGLFETNADQTRLDWDHLEKPI